MNVIIRIRGAFTEWGPQSQALHYLIWLVYPEESWLPEWLPEEWVNRTGRLKWHCFRHHCFLISREDGSSVRGFGILKQAYLPSPDRLNKPGSDVRRTFKRNKSGPETQPCQPLRWHVVKKQRLPLRAGLLLKAITLSSHMKKRASHFGTGSETDTLALVGSQAPWLGFKSVIGGTWTQLACPES